MSDLQDVIAANAVKAYNEGFTRGEASERERIIGLLDQVAIQQHKVIESDSDGKDTIDREIVIATIYQLIALIKGKQQ